MTYLLAREVHLAFPVSENKGNAMNETQTKSRIRQFIFEKFPLARKRQMDDKDSLLDAGIVDSIGILEIVSFIEEAFTIQVTDEDLVPENFATISSVAAFVLRRLQNPASEPQGEGTVYEPRQP